MKKALKAQRDIEQLLMVIFGTGFGGLIILLVAEMTDSGALSLL